MRMLVPWKVLAGALVLAVGVVGHASAGAKKEVRGLTRGSCEISCPKSSCKIDCAGVPDKPNPSCLCGSADYAVCNCSIN